MRTCVLQPAWQKCWSVAPSSSKFNPKRHRKDINFRWLFLVFLGFWTKKPKITTQKPKNARKSHRKLMSFQSLLDWILKMRGVLTCSYLFTSYNSNLTAKSNPMIVIFRWEKHVVWTRNRDPFFCKTITVFIIQRLKNRTNLHFV